MDTQIQPLQEIAKDVLTVLAEQKQLLSQSTEQFEKLSECVRNNTADAIEEMLILITESQQLQVTLDCQLKAIRMGLARQLGCEKEEVSLAVLAEHLEPPLSEQLLLTRQELLVLAEDLKQKHLASAVLIYEASKVNRMLINGLFPPKANVTTYGANGRTGRVSNSSLLNTEL